MTCPHRYLRGFCRRWPKPFPLRRRGLVTRWRSSTRRAPPDRRRACAARMRSFSGGASIPAISWGSAPTTSSARPCRCSIPTRSTLSFRRSLPARPPFSRAGSPPRPSGRRWRPGIALLDGYGSTETNFVIGAPIADQKPGTMGRLFEGFAARVVDAEDNEVPDGAPGEQVLLSHPDIATAAAYPVRSELAEDEVIAAIVRQPGSALDEVAVVRFCETRMPYFAVPRFLEFVDTLPATENGKIQKYKLRERGISDRTWDREAAGITVKRR